MSAHTRREFVRLAGAAAAGSVGVDTGFQSVAGQTAWTRVESPTSKTLYGVVDTTEGPFAVGAGGDVLARRRDGWRKVVDYGPQARSRRLTGVDVTDDGEAIWFVGGSGVIGEYDVASETLTNYSAPKGKTSTWEDCAVRGTNGESERLYFVNGSGELLVGDRQDGGAVKYRDVIEPGGGSTIPGIDFVDRQSGHLCSTSQLVSETTDGGESWTRIGVGFAGTSFFDVASVGPRDVNVAAGNGIVFRYDGFRWTPHVIDDARRAIRAVTRDGDAGLAAGDGGKVYERRSAGQWRRVATGTEAKLYGVARGSHGVDVAVGAGGAIVERVRSGSGGGDGGGGGGGDGSGGEDGGGSNTGTGTATGGTETPAGGTTTAATLADVGAGTKIVRAYREGDWVY